MINYILRFLRFNWLSKKFFIRCFLLIILIAEIFGLYSMMKTGKPDYGFIGILVGTAGGLLTMYTVRKVGEKE